MKPDVAMEGPLLAATSTYKLVLEQLWGALLAVSRSCRHSPRLPVLCWGMLLGTVVLVSLRKIQLTRRRAKAQSQRWTHRHEVDGGGAENAGSTTQAHDALRPPTVGTRPATLRTLCFSAMNTHLTRLQRDAAHVLGKAQKSQPRDLTQVPGEKPIGRESQKDGEQLGKQRMKDVLEKTDWTQRLARLEHDISRWPHAGQEKVGEERLEPSKAHTEPIPRDQASQAPSSPRAGPAMQAVHSPHLPTDRAAATTWGGPPKRGAGHGDHPTHHEALERKGVTELAGFRVFPPSPQTERQHRITQLRAERGEIAVLTRQIHSLRTQKASLQQDNSGLDREIQQLKRKLQETQEEQDQHILQLHRRHFQGQAQHLQVRQKLTSACRDQTFTCHLRNHYQNMAQEMAQEREINSSSYRKAVLSHQDRAAKGWVAAVSSERKCQQLRRENDRLRQRLTGGCSLLPRDPLAPAAPPASCRGWAMTGLPGGVRAPGTREVPL